MSTPAERIDTLIEQIEYHRRKYYVEDSPVISDAEYDALEKELVQLEAAHPELVRPDSPSFRVGAGIADDHPTLPHRTPMLSLENAYGPEELARYFERTHQGGGEDLEYAVELKIDGLSLSVTYENGVMTRALTRGDGKVGEEVTLNAKTIVDLPLRIDAWLDEPIMEVRGEVYLDRKNFERINQVRLDEDKPLFANPRNAAAGTLRMLDSREVAKRRLRIFVFQALGPWADAMGSHLAGLDALGKLGFPINPNNTRLRTRAELETLIEDWAVIRHDLNYETDGVVVKVDDRSTYEEIGYTSKFPKWACAYKFAAEQATTTIQSITIQVGRTGVLTPVANFDQVQLAGTTVSRATLHNFDEISKKDIRVGDRAFIEKGGDIIPKVVKVITEARDDNQVPFEIPTTCPSCGTEVVREEEQVAVKCVNLACPAQMERRLTHFAGRKAMDIQGLGKERVQQLVSAGLVPTLPDIYKLTSQKLWKIERMGGKSIANLLKEIENSKQKSFARLLFATGIPMIGEKVAEVLTEEIGGFDALTKAGPTKVAAIHGLGEKVAEALFENLERDDYKQMFQEFRDLGLTMDVEKVETPEGETGEMPLEGKVIVITGSFTIGSRTDLSKLLKSLGANVTGSVSSRTHILVAGEKAGSKLAKAQALNVEIVDEEWLKQWQNP